MEFLNNPSVTNFLVLIIVWFIILAIYRYHNSKMCRDNIYCEFITDEGTGYHEFHPVIDGMLIVRPTKKRAGAFYPIGNVTTIIVDYPSGVPMWLSFIVSKAKKTILDERTAEPILNRSPMLLLTPQRIANRETERYTALASGQSVIEERKASDALNRGKSGSNINWGLVIGLIILACVIVAVVFYFKNQSMINAQLGR
jgi:hypothetical protein